MKVIQTRFQKSQTLSQPYQDFEHNFFFQVKIRSCKRYLLIKLDAATSTEPEDIGRYPVVMKSLP